MLKSSKPAVFFIHIPKCGGTSVMGSLSAFMSFPVEEFRADLGVEEDDASRRHHEHGFKLNHSHSTLGKIKLDHLPLWLIAEHFPSLWETINRSSSFAVLRDPRDRFLSAVMQRLREFRDIGASTVSDRDIKDEASRVCDWLGARERFHDAEYAHFTRQSEYCEHDGRVVHECLFPLTSMDALYAWLHSEHGLPLVKPEAQRVSRQPRGWLAPVYPVAQFTARRLMPSRLREAIYPLWLKSGAFVASSAGYAQIDLGQDVETFVAEYYRRDRALYHQASEKYTPVAA